MTWNWRTTLGAVLLAAAIISGWSAWQQRARPVAAAVDDSKADYVLRDFELIALDKESGKESMTLRAPEMHRNRADQTSEITTPVFLLPDNANNPWTLRSKTGWISPKGDEMRLRGDVSGDSPTTGNTPPTTFRTESLDVFSAAEPGQDRRAGHHAPAGYHAKRGRLRGRSQDTPVQAPFPGQDPL